MNLTRRTFNTRKLIQRIAQARAQQVYIDTGLGQQMTGRAALLVQQCNHQVRRLDELVILPDSQRLRLSQSHLELACQFFHAHVCVP